MEVLYEKLPPSKNFNVNVVCKFGNYRFDYNFEGPDR